MTTGTEVANRASVPDQECAFVRCDVQLHGDLLSLGLGWKRCVPPACGCRSPWTAATPRQRAARHQGDSADARGLRARGTRTTKRVGGTTANAKARAIRGQRACGNGSRGERRVDLGIRTRDSEITSLVLYQSELGRESPFKAPCVDRAGVPAGCMPEPRSTRGRDGLARSPPRSGSSKTAPSATWPAPTCSARDSNPVPLG